MKHSIHFSRVLPALLALSVAGSVLLTTSGCGGGNNSNESSAPTRKTGAVTMNIKWPQPDGTRKIPLAAQSITVTITGTGGTQSKTVTRTTGSTTATVTLSGLKLGDYTLTSTAFASTNGTGVALATASTMVTFDTAKSSTTATLDLSSTVTRIAVTPDPLTLSNVGANSTLTISATGYDSAGNMVPLASVAYTVTDTSIVTVSTVNGVSSLSALKSGRTSLRATDTESGRFVDVPVEVGRVATAVGSTTLDGPVRTGAAVSFNGNVYAGGSQGRLYGLTAGLVPLSNFPVDLTTVPEQVSEPAFLSNGTVIALDDSGDLVGFNNVSGTEVLRESVGSYAVATGINGSRVINKPIVDASDTIYASTAIGTLEIATPATSGTGYNVTDIIVGNNAEVVNTPSVDATTGNIFVTSSTLTGQSAKLHAFASDGTRLYPEITLDGAVAVGTTQDTDNVYAVTGLTAGTTVNVYAFKKTTGTLLWTKVLPNASLVSGAPTMGPNGVLYVGTWGEASNSGAPVGGQVFALATATGNIVTGWPFRIPFQQNFLYSDIDSSVTVGLDGNIYAGSVNGRLYAIRPDGVKIWEASAFSEIHSTPAVAPNGTVYVGSDNAQFTAFQ